MRPRWIQSTGSRRRGTKRLFHAISVSHQPESLAGKVGGSPRCAPLTLSPCEIRNYVGRFAGQSNSAGGIRRRINIQHSFPIIIVGSRSSLVHDKRFTGGDVVVTHALRLGLLVLLLAVAGCEGQYSYEVTGDRNRTCVISVRNKSLASFLESLEEKLEAKIETDGEVDREEAVTIKLEGQTWKAILQQFCDERRWSLEHDEDTNTYTISADKSA
jgi:hypothetical protein